MTLQYLHGRRENMLVDKQLCASSEQGMCISDGNSGESQSKESSSQREDSDTSAEDVHSVSSAEQLESGKNLG